MVLHFVNIVIIAVFAKEYKMVEDLIVGIDVGVHPAVFKLYFDGSYKLFICKDLKEFQNEMLILPKDTMAIIEKVWSMPGNGHMGAFNFGHSCGFIEGVITSRFNRVYKVAPQKWKSYYKITKHNAGLYDKDKTPSITKAKELYPDETFLATPQSRIPNHNLCEAALLARYLKDNWRNLCQE